MERGNFFQSLQSEAFVYLIVKIENNASANDVTGRIFQYLTSMLCASSFRIRHEIVVDVTWKEHKKVHLLQVHG